MSNGPFLKNKENHFPQYTDEKGVNLSANFVKKTQYFRFNNPRKSYLYVDRSAKQNSSLWRKKPPILKIFLRIKHKKITMLVRGIIAEREIEQPWTKKEKKILRWKEINPEKSIYIETLQQILGLIFYILYLCSFPVS